MVLGVTTLQYQKKTVDALLGLAVHNMFVGHVIPECCLLPQVRNKIIEIAYKQNPDFTHILFIDDDMGGFGPQHVYKLWKDDVDIISALVTGRKPPYKMICDFGPDVTSEDVVQSIKDQEVKESLLVGTAFTLIKRAVFDAMQEDTPNGPIWFTMDRSERPTFEAEAYDFRTKACEELTTGQRPVKEVVDDAIAFGQTSHIGSKLMGEDLVFCAKAKRLGFKLHVDCGVVVGHLGVGNYDFRDAILNMPVARSASDGGSDTDCIAQPSIQHAGMPNNEQGERGVLL